ncbi:hypothetical protein GCM10028864_04500 [Microlunatus parietis]
MVDIDKLKGMPDVTYDFGVSGEVKSAFRAVANTLSGQRGDRSTWRETGLEQFDGRFSEIFKTNGTTQLGDLDEVVTALRAVATKLEDVEEAAREENQRRKTAREWAQRQADRSGFEKGWDEFWGTGEDPPDVNIKETGPAQRVSAPASRPRETPAPGSGGDGGGGTSSAKPSNLRSFATSTEGGDGAFDGKPASLEGKCTDFATSCSWATLDASGPIQGLRDWLRLNGEDSKWATTVADAFARAGGEGNVSTLSNSTIEAALRAANVAVNRQDIVVDPPTAYGSPPTTGYSDDPVNTATGNFIENENDLAFPGASAELGLTRTYNSLNRKLGAFGPGWSSWTEAGLTLTDEAARLRLADGREVVFPRLGQDWDRANGENLWLARDATGYTVTNSAGLRWDLGADGRLLATSTGPGTKINFGYDSDARLISMAHEFGRTLALVWDDDLGRVVSAVASDGRTATFRYDERGRLVAAETPAGTRTYRWNDADLIDAVIDPDGVVEAENTYDALGRVTTQRSPFGRTTRFVYLPGGVTEVSDADGTRANTWIADGKGRLIGVIDADDHRQSTSYDRYGNPVMITDRQGATVINGYDDRGRLIHRETPTGAKIDWEHDDHDRPVTITLHNGDTTAITRYTYEGDERNPAEVIDAEGGLTRMRWDRGLLKEIIDPEGVRLRFDHDHHGELIAATDADGNTARLERDDLGRVIAAITPLGHKTSYRYHANGPLESRRDPDGAIWRYEHTTGGRLSAVIDPTGGRSAIEHGDHGVESRTIDAVGRAYTTEYDELGNVSRVVLPDGAEWSFAHDALSRLVETTDAAGGRWRAGYDANGHLTETIDPTGVRQAVQRDQAGRSVLTADRLTEVRADYDVLGRTVSETGPDGTTQRYRYDRCGRLVDYTDATGAVTRIRRDRAGRPVAVTHPMGSTFHYEYDACGRRVATVDTDGSRYAFSYDADGRLVREDWPTGEQAWISYDPAGRPIRRFEPGAGVSTFAYDALGRVVRTTDGWHGTRHYRYDAAGQLSSVQNAAGGVTRFEYDDNGRCVATIDPLGGRTERSFDAVGRIVAETDPLGRVARYEYDLAGRQTKRVDPSGATLSWRFDDTGRQVESFADGVRLSRVERDFAARTLRLFEPGRDGGEVVNELTYDPEGRLVRRLRGGVGMAWSYDGDGRRVSFTGVHGDQTRYEYDRAGRVSAVEAPELGRAVIDRDAIGRICSMTAPGLHAAWTWTGGAVTRLEVAREGRTQVTEIERDDAGRVTAETTDGVRISYGYDPTGQLVEARRSDGSVTSYGYDAGGRLIRETTDGHSIHYRYDAAGQLLERHGPDGTTGYTYDGAGRRTSEAGPAGERRFGWDPRGFLATITTITHAGDKITARTQQLQVDALGELATVDDQPVAWDTANPVPTLARLGDQDITGFGPLTALLPDPAGRADGQWITPDWRPRPTGTDDPWGIGTGTAPAGLPSGVQVGGQGNLLVDGMEWMQARVYDPGTRGFLSTDPLDPILGTGWAGNPYSFAGNDPLNQSDPWGLKPVTDKELQAYRDSNNGAIAAAWNATTNWVANNWEYIAAGAMIVAGVALMATGVGGPIGLALAGGALSMGMSVAQQKATNGSVDWGQAGLEGVMGMVPIPGAGAASALLKSGAKAVGRTAVGNGVKTFGRNALSSARQYGDNALSKLTGTAKGGCFVAGTQVLLADGVSKPIEEITVGDQVVAADPETGETHLRPVVETFRHEEVETFLVETSAGSVTSTAEHPFYVQGQGWVPVRELVPGNVLIDSNGDPVELIEVVRTGETATVHNFHVDDLHNYHVRTGTRWVRVHNDCKPFAMGIDDHLDDFARQHGATTWKQFDDKLNWQQGVYAKLSDPDQRVLFNLDGVDVWPGVMRAASGRGGPTDWELMQLKQGNFPNVEFWQNGVRVESPFS